MRRASSLRAVTDLQTLSERLERWRQQREGGGARLPQELWDDAVRVARVQGIHPTAKALRFNYYDLKKRVERAESETGEDKKGAFVEVQMSEVGAGVADSKMVVELVGSGGARMRIEVGDARSVDVAGLAHAFWSRQP